MFLAHKILIRPTREQEDYFRRACGTRRFAYNWGLARYKEHLDELKAGVRTDKPQVRKIRDALVALKKTELPWLSEVSSHIVKGAFENLQSAFDKFFSKQNRFPKFASKHDGRDRFTIGRETDSTFAIDSKALRIPKLGWLKLAESLRFEGMIKFATISRQADRWFVSILVDVGDQRYHAPVVNPDMAIGVDLGINVLATLSNGKTFENPRAYRRHENKLRKLQRKLSKKTRGGENYKRLKTKIAKVHARVVNIRTDALHKLTTYLTSDFGHVVIEDLNVKGMLKGRIAKSLSDVSFYTIRTMLDYKSDLRGGQVYLVPRFFPSSQLCSRCGTKKKIPRGERVYSCDHCGHTMDRDLNAAINICQHLTGVPSAA